jgi:hypothetical protein
MKAWAARLSTCFNKSEANASAQKKKDKNMKEAEGTKGNTEKDRKGACAELVLYRC